MSPEKAAILLASILLIRVQQLHSFLENGYHISPYTSNWFEAVEYCHRLGMRLAIADTEDKHNAIAKLGQDTGLWTSGFFGIWLGASDLARTHIYVWHDTGARIRFSRWKAGEPTGGEEHCLNLYYWPQLQFNWTWNDAPCEISLYAVCEKRDRDNNI
ncbi:CD209 antigen-like protein C [Wyeomyia smithii]|uniref:CD209 antigen-like protein C n=1 Tax=Wyeomyia smithii TaxID=174621 RepID=UPI002467D6C1|nr:CD209 antigen-like protein C [Wyeomyia smithii]